MSIKNLLPQLHLWILIVSLGGVMSACNLNNNQDIMLDWEPEILAPLIKGNLGVLQQPNIQNVDFSITVPASSLGLDVFSGTVPLVPAFGPIDTIQRTYTVTDDDNNIIFESVEIDAVTVDVSFTNPFPVILSAGMRIIFRNQGTTTGLITHVTTRDIGPNETYNFQEQASNAILNANLVIALENVQSPGGTNVNFDNLGDLIMNVSLQISPVNAIVFAPNVSASFETIDNFDLGLGDEAENLEGNLILKHDNQTPVNLTIQAYFLAEDQTTVIDSLFQVPSPITAGETTTVTVSSASVLNNLRNTKFIRFNTGFNTNGFTNSVRIDGSTQYNFQIIADVKVKLKN